MLTLLDFSAAFDMVDHVILLHRLVVQLTLRPKNAIRPLWSVEVSRILGGH